MPQYQQNYRYFIRNHNYLFQREITNVFYKNNSVKISQPKKSGPEFRNTKRSLKIDNVRNNSNRGPIKTFTRFDCLDLNHYKINRDLGEG